MTVVGFVYCGFRCAGIDFPDVQSLMQNAARLPRGRYAVYGVFRERPKSSYPYELLGSLKVCAKGRVEFPDLDFEEGES